MSKVAFDIIPPLTLVALRFSLTALVMFAAVRITRAPHVARRDCDRLALTGIAGFAVSIVTQFLGTKLTTEANGALVTSAAPVFIVLFLALILHEPLTARRLPSLVLATLGVVVVVNPGDLSSSLAGNLALLVAAVTWGLYSVLVRVAVRTYPPLTVSAYAVLAGSIATILLVPLALAVTPPGPITQPIVLGLLYLAFIATAGALYLRNRALHILGAGVTSMFFFAQPVTGTLLGWFLLLEKLGVSFLAGGALIPGAVGLTIRK